MSAADPEEGSDMTETPQQQIDRLAAFIMEEVPGEPSQSEGAVDTAIRLIRALAAERVRVAAVEAVVERLEADHYSPVVVGICKQLRAALAADPEGGSE